MGTWGCGLFEDDLSLDIQSEFEEYVEEGLSVEDATVSILENYEDVIEEDESETAVIYLALASLQLDNKCLEDSIRQKALEIISSGAGLDLWEEAGEIALIERKKVLEELRLRLEK